MGIRSIISGKQHPLLSRPANPPDRTLVSERITSMYQFRSSRTDRHIQNKKSKTVWHLLSILLVRIRVEGEIESVPVDLGEMARHTPNNTAEHERSLVRVQGPATSFHECLTVKPLVLQRCKIRITDKWRHSVADATAKPYHMACATFWGRMQGPTSRCTFCICTTNYCLRRVGQHVQ